MARIVKELAPPTEVKVIGSSGDASGKNAPPDLSLSKAELGYSPRFPLKEALRDYMDELWGNGKSSASIRQPKADQIVERGNPVFPCDLLALGISSAVIRNGYFVEPALLFRELDGDLGFEAEAL